MLDLIVQINSYNRERQLTRLLHQLQGELKSLDYYIYVNLDGYEVENRVKSGHITYISHSRHGKRFYYQLNQNFWNKLGDAEHFLKLDDDVVLVDGFLEKMIASWDSIEDQDKIALNILMDQRSDMWGNKQYPYNEYVLQSNWTDLNFFGDKRLIFALQNISGLVPPPRNYTSSGVGYQLNRYLNTFGTIYRVRETLIKHGNHLSVMNPNRKEKLTDI